MTRHPDLITRAEAAELLGVPRSRLDRGWGPPPLPHSKRPVFYSREHCEQWYEQQKELAWACISEKGRSIGGVGSKLPATKSGNRLAQQIAAQLRSRKDDSATTTKGKHLIAVPGRVQG